MCWRTSQSKISAPPPVSDSRPASISSSRISSAGRPEIFSNQWISVAVKHFRLTFGSAAFSSRSTLRVVAPRQRRVQAVDDVQLGELLVLHLLGLAHRLLDAHRVRVLLARLALERAVRAGRRADVGQVEVPVDVEHHPVAVHLGAPWWASRPSQARSSRLVEGARRPRGSAARPRRPSPPARASARHPCAPLSTFTRGRAYVPPPTTIRPPHRAGRPSVTMTDLAILRRPFISDRSTAMPSWGMTFMGDEQRRVADRRGRGAAWRRCRQHGRARRVTPMVASAGVFGCRRRRDRRPLHPAARLGRTAGPAGPGRPCRPCRTRARGPMPLGTLVMPGQSDRHAAATTPVADARRGHDAAAGQDREAPRRDRHARRQADQARRGPRPRQRSRSPPPTKKVADTQAALVKAKQDAAAAAAAAMRDQAALPPGTLGSGLADLDALARMQRGDSATEEAAARQLAILQAAQTAATAEQATATTNATELLRPVRQAQRGDHQEAGGAAEARAEARRRDLRGRGRARAPPTARSARNTSPAPSDGRGADPRAIAALTVRAGPARRPVRLVGGGPGPVRLLRPDVRGVPQRGGRQLTRSPGCPATSTAQTRSKAVDRYSLLPGDLLFFSSSNSWQDIHHVAMYAGNGMMVEAPRTGLDVRLVPVRWTRLFQATRVYGSVEGSTEAPDLTEPPPGDPRTPTTESADDQAADHQPTTTPTTPPTSPTDPSEPPTDHAVVRPAVERADHAADHGHPERADRRLRRRQATTSRRRRPSRPAGPAVVGRSPSGSSSSGESPSQTGSSSESASQLGIGLTVVHPASSSASASASATRE